MMQHSRRLKAAILLVLLGPAAAPAQHHDMGRLWDSLTARADPQALEALAHSPDTAAAHPAAASLVKQGLVALRRFQLTGSQRDAAAARAAFEEATRRHPGFAWAFFGLGLTFVQAPLLRSPGMSAVGGGIGLDAGTLARNAFSRALELDPSFVQPARALAELALETREPEELRGGRDALEGVLATGRGHTELWLMRAELEIALGRAGAALAAADSALRAGGDVALALRARAAALFAEAGADSAGAATYLAGLEHLTPSAAERYFDDVALIATPAETRAWGAADLAGRGAWLRRFWEERAARDGITVAQRVATHYHRLAKALSDFHWRWLEDATPPGALLRETLARRPLDVDDRGVVLVRHGEPDKVVRTHLPYVQPNETWVYFRPGADLLFTFAQLRQASGWRLVDDILALVEWDAHVHERAAKSFLTLRFLSDSALGQLQQLGFFEYAQELLQELAPYEPGYGQILGRLHMVDIGNPRFALSDATMPYLEVGARLRERALAALATDADWPRFERELPFHYDLFTFRGADGRTDLLAALAVPGERLEAAGEEGRAKKALYVLRTRLIVLDTPRGLVARRDTVQVFQAAAPLQPGEYLRAHLTLEVSPAESALHRVVVEGS
ncbi:MAG: hypothetical protein HY703_08050, partial [Gemmatimonadetes bacterium]|nr:hypothetical protein [Gemmatimonadota bacterium]